MNDCAFRFNTPKHGICLKNHHEILPGYCDECPGYFPKANISPLVRAFNSMTKEDQKRCTFEMNTRKNV